MLLRRLAPLALLVALLAVACGGTSTVSEPAAGGGVAPEFTNDATKDQGLLPIVTPGSGDGSALVVTSSLSIAVDAIDPAIAEARAIVTRAGGVLVGISRGSDGGVPFYTADGSLAALDDAPAYLTFRLPAAALESTIDALRPLGELVGERTDASDVSASLRDLGARLKNLRAAEANYLRLLDQANEINDLLAITAQLDSVRGQIEQLAAEEATLADAVARSTLSLALYPPATPIADATATFDPGAIVASAVGTLLAVGIATLTGLIYLLVIGLPVALLLAVAYLLVGRRLRARLGRAPRRR